MTIQGPITIILKRASNLSFLFKNIPLSFTVIITLITLIGSLMTAITQQEPTIFIKSIGTEIFLADLGLQDSVNTLKTGQLSTLSSIWLFIDSISDVMMIYYLNKFIAKAYAAFTGAGGAWFGYWFASFTVLGALEVGIAGALRHELIVPYMGVFMFLINVPLFFEPVIEMSKSFIAKIRYFNQYDISLMEYWNGEYNKTKITEIKNKTQLINSSIN